MTDAAPLDPQRRLFRRPPRPPAPVPLPRVIRSGQTIRLPSLKPTDIGLVTGDYRTGKSTFIKAWAQSLGRAAFWGAASKPGAPVEYSDIAVVVRSAREMEAAARKAPYVVWPSPPQSAGMEAVKAAFNDFCRVANRFRDALVVCDELQRITEDKKQLTNMPPAFLDLVESGHKPPNNLAKIFVAHRLAQIPLNLGAGAYRVSTRCFPGDERALEPVFGRDNTRRIRHFEQGEFAFWSADTGPILPCRLDLSGRGWAGVTPAHPAALPSGGAPRAE